MKPRTVSVASHIRTLPERKADPVFISKTEQLWDELFIAALIEALRGEIDARDGFELHGGLT